MLFIFSGLNIKIGNDASSPAPPIYPCPKGTNVLEDLLLCLLLLFKCLRETGRGIKYIVKREVDFTACWASSTFFCSCFSHTCAHIRLFQITTILFIQSSSILICLVRVTNICGNQLTQSDELLDPDSKDINSQNPTTKFAWTVTLTYFLRSSHLAFSFYVLMVIFFFLPLFLLKYS